jgi:hypothetical protein
MGRSASIDPLALHNFRLALDSIIGKYDDSKSDKAGEFLNDKNIYANEQDWTKCWWTGLAIWAAVNTERLSVTERLFLSKNSKYGSASKRYCEQLLGILENHRAEVETMMRANHVNPYGLRKGAATYAVSGTTAPPSLPSIARRGDWSMGDVLDVYWHFAKVGDEYLGRILRGVSPNDPEFDSLPPHWNIPLAHENEHVIKAMRMLYGIVLDAYEGMPDKDPRGLLHRCLPCLVFHSMEISAVMVAHPGHPLSKISILHDEELLTELRKLVTLKPTPGVMMVATGIPPHIALSRQLKEVMSTIILLSTSFESRSEDLVIAVKESIEKQAWESGHVSGTRLKELLDGFHTENRKEFSLMRVEISKIREEDPQEGAGAGRSGGDSRRPRRQTQDQVVVNMYCYHSRYYYVPEDFQFPKVKLRDALRFWVLGQSVSVDGSQAVQPYRKLGAANIPKRLVGLFQTQWVPIFKFISERGVDFSQDNISETTLENLYEECVNVLKSHVSYCFQRKSGVNPLDYSLGTWSNKTSRSSISNFGTDDDKLKLSEPTMRNKSRHHKFARKKRTSQRPLYPRRQAKRNRPGPSNVPTNSPTDNAFDREFSTSETDYTRRRGEEIKQQVLKEDQQQEAKDDEEVPTNKGLYYNQPRGVSRNHGDLSGLGRKLYGERLQEEAEFPSPGDDDDDNDDFSSKQLKRVVPGPCAVQPCLIPTVQVCMLCYGKDCDKPVHRHCCANLKTRYELHVGDLGGRNEMVFCSDICKRSRKKKKTSTASAKPKDPHQSTGATDEHSKHVQWLKANFTTVNNAGKRKGRCAVAGCEYHNQQLEGNGSHRCKKCQVPVHNLCSMTNGLSDAGDESIKYCSEECKRK